MIQQITPAFLQFPWKDAYFRAKPILKYCLPILGSIWMLGLAARPTSPSLFPENPDANTGILSDTTIEANICDGDTYLFDGQLLDMPGEYSATYVGSDGADSTVTLHLFVLPVSMTTLEATICAGEAYPFDGQELDQSGTYSATYVAENGCDSIVTLHLDVLPPVNTLLSASICEGSGYTFQGDILTETGVYSIVLPAGTGCDSIVTLNLNVVAFFEVSVAASICDGDTYVFGNDTLKEAGVYVDSLTAHGGCDSIVTLTLGLLPISTTHWTAGICEGSSYVFEGETLTDEGVYIAQYQGVNGCDSMIILDLSVVPFFDIQLESSICANEVYVFGNDTLDAPGTYTNAYTAVGGCDSIVTLTLTVLPTSSGTDGATICFGGVYEYNGEPLTDAGDYTFHFTGENGCDSTVIFTLNVLPAIGSTLEASICEGDTYDFSGLSLADAGVYEAILTAENGCDSIVTLTLTVLPTHETSLSASICDGDAYDYNGESLTDAGTYTFVYTGENGCDSTVTLVLTVNPVQHTDLQASICEGDSYQFDGILLSDAGTYNATYLSENGCDSTVTLVLEILPLQNTAIEATICANETYDFNGESLNTAGTYTAVLTAENGCDSTVVLTLSVLPVQNTSIPATICDGDSYAYGGVLLTTAGDFDFVFVGENGCDSTVTISLTVLPVAQTNLEATICAGGSYDYNGEILTDAGDYLYTYTGENGCDSVVTLSLHVLPLLSSETAVSLCAGGSYVFNGDTISVSGVYSHVSTGSNGCDSTAVLILEFVNEFNTFLDASICDGESYIFGNDTLTDSGIYTYLFTAQGGCDSVLTLTITVLPLSGSTTDAVICDGESYDFNGQSLSVEGTYTAILTGVNGCDSTAVLNLIVLPTQSTSIEASICANETYNFNGMALSDPGTYTIILESENGCDSTVTLTLDVLPVQGSNLSATICSNQSYDFNGESLMQTGVYTAVLEGANGCDSTVTLELNVLPIAESAFAASVCNGEPFEYNNQVLTESGEYQFVYEGAAANGCDSVETLFLTIFPAIPPTTVSATICVGGFYNFYGMILTAAGIYTADLSSSVGCDSTIILQLSVAPVFVTPISATICAGDSYLFDGQNLTNAGVYMAFLQSVAGCDSTVVLTLSVNTVNTNVSQQGGTLTAAATNATYQWINCANNQNIPGATGNSFTPTVTGNYAVAVTQNGCTATSTCVFVQVVSVQELLNDQAWNVQPNPANSSTRVVFEEATSQDLWLEIRDLAGRLLHSQSVGAGTKSLDLELGNMPDGILVIRLASEQAVASKRLMKAGR